MNLNAISSLTSSAALGGNLHLHGHKRSGQSGSESSTNTVDGQPAAAGSTQGLLGTLFDTVEQVIGIGATALASRVPGLTAGVNAIAGAIGSGAAASSTSASSTSASTTSASSASTATPAASAPPAPPGVAQNVQGFLHSLLQALQGDGLTAGPPTAAATAGSAAASSAATAGGATTANAGTAATSNPAGLTGTHIAATSLAHRYEGGLESSLQALIQQVNANGASSSATADLNASFNNLVQGLSATPAVAGAAATAAPTSGAVTASSGAAATASSDGTAAASSAPSLQTFLSQLLQNLQSTGVHHSSSLVGTNVDANV